MWRPANEALRCLLAVALVVVVDAAGSGHAAGALDVTGSDLHASGRRNFFRKHGASPVAAAAETLVLEMSNYLGVQYIAPITIGSQALSAVYDTGSFDIMAVSTGCTVCKSSLRAYNNANSSTFASGGRPAAEHEYVSGKVTAKQDFESVRVGGVDSPLLTQSMPFWQVVDTDIEIWTKDRAQFTVIVGLGHSDTVPKADGRPSRSPSLMEKVNAQRFAICLERGEDNPGWLTINPKMSAATQSLFRTVPVVGNNHWSTPMPSVEVVGFTANLCRRRCVGIIDSGTSMIGIPTAAIVEMDELINQISADCQDMDLLPDITLNIGEHSFTLPPSAYVLKISSEISNGQVFESCLPAFMNIDMETDDGDVWILGMPFLRNFYTVFDREGPSIHIAGQGPKCEPVKEEVEEDPYMLNSAALNSTEPEMLNLHNSKGLVAKRRRKLPSLPTRADVRMARGPMWAGRNGTKLVL